MSETENPPSTETALPKDDEAPKTSLEAEDFEDFEDFANADSEDLKKFKIKDSLQSSDSPSRYLMVLAFLFAFLALVCLGLLVTHYLKQRRAASIQVTEAPVTEVVEPTVTAPLGEVQVNWPNAELRVSLSVECSDHSTCEELKSRTPEAYDAAISVLQGSSREEILNPVKKQILRRTIAEKFNGLKLSGKVIQVHFTDMTVEVSH